MSALQKAKHEALAVRLGAVAPAAAAGWVAAARADALARVQVTGLPTRRDEYWRYTDPAALVAAAAPVVPVGDAEVNPFADIARVNLVFVDGVFDAAASTLTAVEGLEIARLSEVAGAADHWAAGIYGTLEAKGQVPVERPLAALNTALATEGLLVRVSGKASVALAVEHRQGSGAADAMLHHVIELAEGAEVTLLESGTPAARFNSVMEVVVGDGARFHHVRTQGRSHERLLNTHVFARLGADSLFKSFTLTANGRLTRNEAVLDLTGDDAFAHVAGAVVGDGRDFLHDDTVFVTHGAERCESRQVFKKVLKNGATGVFQGKILVKPGAQKTDGYQISQSLLLDGDSNFLAKPELEIYADDVKCSHGSTSGAIDEQALYYLRSRGVPKAVAEGLLVLSFLAEAIQEIEDEALSDAIIAQVQDWLESHRVGAV